MGKLWGELQRSVVETTEKTAAEFITPFPGLQPDHKLSTEELISSTRQAIAAEEEAAHFYDAVAAATDNETVADIFRDIAKEERVHVGEFLEILERLAPEESALIEKGRNEVREKEAAEALFDFRGALADPLTWSVAREVVKQAQRKGR